MNLVSYYKVLFLVLCNKGLTQQLLHAFLFHLLTSSWLTLRSNTTYLTEKGTLILYIWSMETSFSKILLAGFAQNEWVKRN